jgi:hypothetical protein
VSWTPAVRMFMENVPAVRKAPPIIIGVVKRGLS